MVRRRTHQVGFFWQIRSAFCLKRGSSHTNRFQRFAVTRTPLLEKGVPLALAPRGSRLGVVRRYLAVALPLLEQIVVLLRRHQLQKISQVRVLKTKEPLSRSIKQRLLW